MIEAIHALVAEIAVATSSHLDYLAVGAEAAGLHSLQQFCHVERRVRFDYPRITEPDSYAE